MKIFLAGATGVIGRRLIPLLTGAGHFVSGTTRDADKVPALKRTGAQPIVLDVFNQRALHDAVTRVKPDVVINQLTNLPKVFDPAQLAEMLPENSRLRVEGTRNLASAARVAGVRRFIAQSLAFAYAEGPEPHAETDPIASGEGNSPSAVTARGVRALEEFVLSRLRISTASCCAMAGCMDRAPGRRRRRGGRRCTWTPLRRLHSLQSRTGRLASTTLPRTTGR